MNTKNYHLLTVKYLGPTNSRGSRVKISSDRFEDSITIGYNHSFNGSLAQAVAWCEAYKDTLLSDRAFNVIGTAEGKGPISYIITDTFKGLREVSR